MAFRQIPVTNVTSPALQISKPGWARACAALLNILQDIKAADSVCAREASARLGTCSFSTSSPSLVCTDCTCAAFLLSRFHSLAFTLAHRVGVCTSLIYALVQVMSSGSKGKAKKVLFVIVLSHSHNHILSHSPLPHTTSRQNVVFSFSSYFSFLLCTPLRD
jgi:hypothetical protein